MSNTLDFCSWLRDGLGTQTQTATHWFHRSAIRDKAARGVDLPPRVGRFATGPHVPCCGLERSYWPRSLVARLSPLKKQFFGEFADANCNGRLMKSWSYEKTP